MAETWRRYFRAPSFISESHDTQLTASGSPESTKDLHGKMKPVVQKKKMTTQVDQKFGQLNILPTSFVTDC